MKRQASPMSVEANVPQARQPVIASISPGRTSVWRGDGRSHAAAGLWRMIGRWLVVAMLTAPLPAHAAEQTFPLTGRDGVAVKFVLSLDSLGGMHAGNFFFENRNAYAVKVFWDAVYQTRGGARKVAPNKGPVRVKASASARTGWMGDGEVFEKKDLPAGVGLEKLRIERDDGQGSGGATASADSTAPRPRGAAGTDSATPDRATRRDATPTPATPPASTADDTAWRRPYEAREQAARARAEADANRSAQAYEANARQKAAVTSARAVTKWRKASARREAAWRRSTAAAARARNRGFVEQETRAVAEAKEAARRAVKSKEEDALLKILRKDATKAQISSSEQPAQKPPKTVVKNGTDWLFDAALTGAGRKAKPLEPGATGPSRKVEPRSVDWLFQKATGSRPRTVEATPQVAPEARTPLTRHNTRIPQNEKLPHNVLPEPPAKTRAAEPLRQTGNHRRELQRQTEERNRQADERRREQLQRQTEERNRQADERRREQLQRQTEERNRQADERRREQLQRQTEERNRLAEERRREQLQQRQADERQRLAEERRRERERQQAEERQRQAEERRRERERQQAEDRRQEERRRQEEDRRQRERGGARR